MDREIHWTALRVAADEAWGCWTKGAHIKYHQPKPDQQLACILHRPLRSLLVPGLRLALPSSIGNAIPNCCAWPVFHLRTVQRSEAHPATASLLPFGSQVGQRLHGRWSWGPNSRLADAVQQGSLGGGGPSLTGGGGRDLFEVDPSSCSCMAAFGAP